MGIGRVELDQLLSRAWGIIDLGVWHALREHSLREDRVRNHITRLVTPRGPRIYVTIHSDIMNTDLATGH